MRKTLASVGIACLAMMISTPAVMAGPAADALGECLADSTTGKDRKALAKWIFSAISAHPEMQDISKQNPANRDQMDRTIGEMVTKLLTESCRTQTLAAVDQEGGAALQSGFSVLGELAMAELLSNEEVKTSFSGFEKYVDKQKLEASFTGK
jgi:hypothetical protein